MAVVLDELERSAGQAIPAGVGQFHRGVQQQGADHQSGRGDERVQCQEVRERSLRQQISIWDLFYY